MVRGAVRPLTIWRYIVSNREIGTAGVVVYIAAFWAAMAALGVYITSNTAPTAPELAWQDEAATTLTKMTVNIARESQDRDGNEVSYTYAWFRNGEPVEGRITQNMSSKESKKGDVFKVVVTPDDGTMGGWGCGLPWRECAGAVTSELEVTVGNALPRARIDFANADGEIIELAPDARRDDVYLDLSCSDPDQNDIERELRLAAKEKGETYKKPEDAPDPCTYTIDWFKLEFDANGERIEREEVPEGEEPVRSEYTEAMLPKRTANKGEAWEVVVVANDGDEDGESASEILYYAQ